MSGSYKLWKKNITSFKNIRIVCMFIIDTTDDDFPDFPQILLKTSLKAHL